MKRLSLVELVVYGATALIVLAACVAGQCHAEQAQSIWNLYSETIPKDGWAVDSQVTVGPGKSIVQPKRTAASSPWDGTLQPFTITVPSLEDYDCQPCTDTSSTRSRCWRDTARVMVTAEADGVWRRYYRTWFNVARDSVLLVNDWVLPAGRWQVKTIAVQPGIESCWSPVFQRVSIMPRRVRPQ